MYRDPVVIRAAEWCRRRWEDRCAARALAQVAVHLSDEADDDTATAAVVVIDPKSPAGVASHRYRALCDRHEDRWERLEAEHARCDLLAEAWQRLVSHDCLACSPDDPEACQEYQARNAEVNDLLKDVTWWRRRRVFRRLRLARRTWWNGPRRWA